MYLHAYVHTLINTGRIVSLGQWQQMEKGHIAICTCVHVYACRYVHVYIFMHAYKYSAYSGETEPSMA